tara:strand:- start:624 stop:935 length:312 start_codon:yes stop_codon:yes gene_type:complete
MFTEGDTRWIKSHTEKTLKELNMRKTKTRPAKRNDNPIVGKLLKLKYRINNAYRAGVVGFDTRADKNWVMNLISDVRENDIKILSKEDGLKCNGLWKDYVNYE